MSDKSPFLISEMVTQPTDGTQFESRKILVNRLQEEGRLLPIQDSDSRARLYFKDTTKYQLINIASGEDSRVYIYKNNETGEIGLVKVYGEHITRELLLQYFEFTQQVAQVLPDIGQELDLSLQIGPETYAVGFQAAQPDSIEERNGCQGAFFSTDWVRGDNLYGERTMAEQQSTDFMRVEDITEGPLGEDDSRFVLLPYLHLDTRLDILEALVDSIEEKTGIILTEIELKNVKLRIDRKRKILYFVITDLCSGISDLERQEDLQPVDEKGMSST